MMEAVWGIVLADEYKERAVQKISKSHEDYLSAIVALGGSTERSIRSVDIAKKMGVSKASVNKAITSLKEMDLVSQPYYGDVTLTPNGQAYGSKIVERHKLLVVFMEKTLGIAPKIAEEEAHLMEHAISDSSFERWTAYIKDLGLSY